MYMYVYVYMYMHMHMFIYDIALYRTVLIYNHIIVDTMGTIAVW